LIDSENESDGGAILPGIKEIDASHEEVVAKELFFQVPLILDAVMSKKFTKKIVYIDLVIGDDGQNAEDEIVAFREVMYGLRKKLAESESEIEINWRITQKATGRIEKGFVDVTHL